MKMVNTLANIIIDTIFQLCDVVQKIHYYKLHNNVTTNVNTR